MLPHLRRTALFLCRASPALTALTTSQTSARVFSSMAWRCSGRTNNELVDNMKGMLALLQLLLPRDTHHVHVWTYRSGNRSNGACGGGDESGVWFDKLQLVEE
ncbi:hypothetical protein HDV00_007978 [Rhizophlyctis rosea]|nr:hypothetical protein HDV00_007978 [Rhizophlyctis rosea]